MVGARHVSLGEFLHGRQRRIAGDHDLVDLGKSRERDEGRPAQRRLLDEGQDTRPGGDLGLYCAVIVKRVDAQTRSKTSINDLLRD